MTFRNITVDNSVKIISHSEQTKERDNKPNTLKSNSPPRKQNTIISQNNKNLLNIKAVQGFRILN